jgi:hypothetical protein
MRFLKCFLKVMGVILILLVLLILLFDHSISDFGEMTLGYAIFFIFPAVIIALGITQATTLKR